MMDTTIYVMSSGALVGALIATIVGLIRMRGNKMSNDKDVIVCRVWGRTKDNTKHITVPKKCKLQVDDYVRLVRVEY